MSSKSPNIEKVYFTIGEVVKIVGVNASVIRYWESRFDEINPMKSSKGTRLFSTEDIEKLKLIKYLVRDRGLTINGAIKKLKENRDETVQNWEIVARLQKIRSELQIIRNELE